MSAAVVHVIEDDALTRQAITELLAPLQVRVRAYGAARDFLDRYAPAASECVVSDILMPELDGLQMQRQLAARHAVPPPLIFLTGVTEIPSVVAAMRAGAFDFIGKPVDSASLLSRTREALVCSRALHARRQARAVHGERLAKLTARERDIADCVMAGQSSREIAAAYGLSVRTVENHRASLMDKLQASSVVELVRMLL